MENKTIKDLSVVELKASVYDCLINIEQNQAIIKALNEELVSRNQKPVENKEEVKVEEEVKSE